MKQPKNHHISDELKEFMFKHKFESIDSIIKLPKEKLIMMKGITLFIILEINYIKGELII